MRQEQERGGQILKKGQNSFSTPTCKGREDGFLTLFTTSVSLSLSSSLQLGLPWRLSHLCEGWGMEGGRQIKQRTLLSLMSTVLDASSPVAASVCDTFLDEHTIWSPHVAVRMGELPGVMWLQVNFSGPQFAHVGNTNLDIVLSVNTHFLTTSVERHSLQFSSVAQ